MSQSRTAALAITLACLLPGLVHAQVRDSWVGLMVGSTAVDTTHPVPVTVATGSGSTFNAALPSTGTAVGASNGTNLVPFLVDGSGYLEVSCLVGCSGGLAQGADTSGQLGSLTMGAVTTSAPTYTTAKTNPLSLTTGGSLRTADSSVVTALSGVATAANQASQLTQETTTATGVGAPADAAWTSGSGSVIALLKALAARGQAVMASSLPVAIASNQSTLPVGGTVATNVAITQNPLNLGAQAVSSENATVTTARQVQLVADLVGKLIVLPYANPENFVSGVITSAMTGTTSTSLIAAPASGLRNYITQCTFSNSHATVGTMMILQDGSGGTTIYSGPVAPAYGGVTITFPTPLRQPTTATALYVQNVTTGSNTFAACSGYKGA